MSNILIHAANFFGYAVIALFAQNAVFTRALGVSRLTKMIEDGTDRWIFGILLCCIQIISTPLGFWLNEQLKDYYYRIYLRPLIFILCSVFAFFLVLGVIIALKKLEVARRVVEVLPMATFHTCIIGTMLVTTSSGYTFTQAMGFALGSSLGYMLAVEVVAEGMRKLSHHKIPYIFRGLPITLLYIGILAIAIYGFTGHRVVF